jgi:DNA-binding winged helix-turn-helix (wHTH) protein/tetratricopeptide (TPR) repeat protein
MIYRFGDCELDDRRYELRRGGVPRHLEPQVFEVLLHLVRNRDRVVTKTELLDHVWGSRFVTDSALTSRLKAARQAVGDSGRAQQVIGTVHGRGYRFLASVQEQHQDPPTPASPPAPAQPAPAAPAPPALAAAPVGRTAELERLAGLYSLAAGGRCQVAFVTGEAGIGKTTLVEAFAAAAGGDALVARGQCLEHRGPSEPYLPVLDALARLGREEGRAVLAPLARAAPTWLAQLPGLIDPGDRETLALRALGGTQARMLREAAEALAAVGEDRPLVLVLEDLHWADPSTVDLVDWLARSDSRARLLVLGTYRPADALAAGHPIGAAAADLRLRGRAQELRLGELDLPAVAAVLEARLPGAEVPEELTRLVHRRTDGVPLFVAQLAQAWTDAGALRQVAGRWELAPGQDGTSPEVADVPDDLRRLIELQLDRLDPADLAALEAAAVGGVEFAAATAAASGPAAVEEVERRFAALARHGRFLRATGPVAWPDGTVSAGFAFVHDLHRAVLYDRVPAGRRTRLHAAVAGRLERAYGLEAQTHAAELATQFLHGHDHAGAVRYLQAAAEQALSRSAYREALQHLELLLAALARLPEGGQRDQAELAARIALGPVLIVTRGFASPEAEAAFVRARELCEALARPRELAVVLHGLAAVNEFRARYHVSQELLEQVLALGEGELIVEAHELLACSTFHQGAAARAVGYAERGLALYDQGRGTLHLAPYGEHPAVCCHYWAALALWFLGRPDSALRHADQAVALAREHPYSLASAEVQLAYLHQYRGEAPETLRWAEQATATATGHGFPIRAAQAAILAGWARTTAGAGDGVGELRGGLAAYLATGAELDHPYYLGLLGDALASTGKVEQGLEMVEEAIAMAGTARPFYYLPELHRLRGDLLARDPGRAGPAAAAYGRAIELAAAHGARSPELRATARLCRLPAGARPADALARLAELYDRFDEGAGTPDLRVARSLLEAG